MKFRVKFERVYTKNGFSEIGFWRNTSNDELTGTSYTETKYRYGISSFDLYNYRNNKDSNHIKLEKQTEWYKISYFNKDLRIRLIFMEVPSENPFLRKCIKTNRDVVQNIIKPFLIDRDENKQKRKKARVRSLSDIELVEFMRMMNSYTGNSRDLNIGEFIYTDIYNNKVNTNYFVFRERSPEDRKNFLSYKTLEGNVKAISEGKLPISILPNYQKIYTMYKYLPKTETVIIN